MDVRLQRRYWKLVAEHMNTPQKLAAGVKAAPGTAQSFASTQAMWRFLDNERVSLKQLIEPPRTIGRQAASESPSDYALVVHDWSKLSYPDHSSKEDQTQLSNVHDVGYEMYTALLVDGANGNPLAPMELQLLSAKGVHTTRTHRKGKRVHHLDQILPTMRAARQWDVPRQLVHIIDAEADSLAEFRAWNQADELFLVRADFTRKVDWQGESYLLPQLAETLHEQQLFQETGEVSIRGGKGTRWVAEGEVVLSRPARKRTAAGRIKLPHQPLTLRLVISRVVNDAGKILAEWYLLTNVGPDVNKVTIADWYYWRWRIESYHKLLKSGGQQLESWQQESAEAIAKRLLISAMVCVCAWEIERYTTPEGEEFKQFVVRLSGRQMKRSRPVTTPAIIAGLYLYLSMLEIQEHYSLADLKRLATNIIPFRMLHKTG
jgi:hypothetical protein